MSIESINQSNSPVEANPFAPTPEELAAREQLLAPDDDVDYYASSPANSVEINQASPVFEIPKLEDRGPYDPAPAPKVFENKLLPASQIPLLEPDNSEPRHRL